MCCCTDPGASHDKTASSTPPPCRQFLYTVILSVSSRFQPLSLGGEHASSTSCTLRARSSKLFKCGEDASSAAGSCLGSSMALASLRHSLALSKSKALACMTALCSNASLCSIRPCLISALSCRTTSAISASPAVASSSALSSDCAEAALGMSSLGLDDASLSAPDSRLPAVVSFDSIDCKPDSSPGLTPLSGPSTASIDNSASPRLA
mmetsp:Transcript_15856/g.28944  ORF Transcript_15856/g.28944 Transcript_15856/m.28944 type:complete len:208 (+) Transcript_15856:726-1349(+)